MTLVTRVPVFVQRHQRNVVLPVDSLLSTRVPLLVRVPCALGELFFCMVALLPLLSSGALDTFHLFSCKTKSVALTP